jgi:hypothetical protein
VDVIGVTTDDGGGQQRLLPHGSWASCFATAPPEPERNRSQAGKRWMDSETLWYVPIWTLKSHFKKPGAKTDFHMTQKKISPGGADETILFAGRANYQPG